MDADVIIIGAGLAGMSAAHEAVKRGRKVILLDQ
ncbi:MAG: FAD-dependent oxidoreductase, partial [Alterinioella nitratireducens]